MRRVIIESPYAGDVEANVAYARACLRDSLARGEAPIASHLLYTQPGVLLEDVPSERAWGIEAGLVWASVADARAFYVDRGWSGGMLAARVRYDDARLSYEERTLPGYVAPEAKSDSVFTLRAWGDDEPTIELLADELERIAPLVREGYASGEAVMSEDFNGRGWWDRTGFVERG